jgi:hypothetical protein
MKTKCIAFAILIAFLLTGCASMSVKVDYDSEADFSAYKTFGWMKMKERPKYSQKYPNKALMEERIKRAVVREMEAKGYSFTDKKKPDIVIAYHIGMQDRVSVEHYGYSYWRRGPRRTEVHRYKEGTLILDFVDPKGQQLVWRGWATGVISGPERMEEHIDNAVKSIIAKYPPQ